MANSLELLRNGQPHEKPTSESANPEYDAYRKSPRWLKMRRAVMLRARNKCQICRRKSGTDLAHLTYDRFFHEHIEDFLWLCRSCHRELDHRE